MSQKRMFSKLIVHSDAFMDMPQSTQLLYFFLNMDADDDGFVSNPKRIMRTIGSSEDDYKILVGKRFILIFEGGICVIKHWRIHNYIQPDRYKETKYVEHKRDLFLKENNAYTDTQPNSPKQLPKQKDDLPEWLDRDAWAKWLQYKKERKEKMAQTTIAFQLKRLENMGIDKHVAIIENTMANGWKGFYPIKEDVETKKVTRDI